MSDLRGHIHAAATTVDDGAELDLGALQQRVVRRRQRRVAAVGAAAVVLMLAAGGGVLAAQRGSDTGSLSTRNGSSEPTVPTTEPSTTTTHTATTSTIPGTTTVPSQGPGPTNASGSNSSITAAPTSGLGNFDDVTVTATGVPNGSYDVGQCPAGHVGDLNQCLLNDVVDVTDGHLSAKVHVFWWMNTGQVDCGAAAGTCVVGLQSADPRVAFAPRTFDLAFDPAKRPRIEVTPNTGLADGQEIQVRGINVGAGSVSFAECLKDQWATCQYADATAGADGNFTATFAAQRVLHWMYQGEIDQAGECGVDGDCVIEVWVTPNGFENFDSTRYRVWIEPTNPAALAFAPAPPPTTTSTTAP